MTLAQHIGYVKRGTGKDADIKVSISVDAFNEAETYTGEDGKEYVGLVINTARLLDVIEGKRRLTNITQIVR